MAPEEATIETKQLRTASSTLEGLKESFPFPEMRPAQGSSLGVIAQTHDDENKKFTIIEAPTGSGKSGIGLAPAIFSANYMENGGAHYLTSQNALSAQLTRDFGSRGLVELRGKSNYKCIQHIPQDCKTGATMNRGGGRTCEGCPYRSAKNRYMSGKLGVTNYTYYLTETMHSGELGPRYYNIDDEAHNVEREILAMVDINITQHRAQDVGAGRIPNFEVTDDAKARRWLTQTYVPAARKHLNMLAEELESMRELSQQPTNEQQNRYDGLKQMLNNLELYLETEYPGDWLSWSDNQGTLCIKPLTAADFAQNYLFQGAQKVVLMSATILDFDTFRRNLGIKKSTANTFAVPSDFPVKNRRIVFWPVGSMGAKSIEATLPRMVERTGAILSMPKHLNTKGIIHTHSYKINQFLTNALSQTEHARRILSHSNASGSRERAIEQHFASDEPTILTSPSMTEGLDLKGDLSRVQIITKVPYPYLDPYNRTRMERDPKWYQLQTALTLVQATGRSVRSIDDYALTVILDADFGRFLSQNQDILPKWWTDSIEFR